ncbi:uncharacterized protein [Dysidea avara]|uniref:uncharacterized protein n=1 Tax=Dysidea avara TaxID=196820 RepID=UPI003325781B
MFTRLINGLSKSTDYDVIVLKTQSIDQELIDEIYHKHLTAKFLDSDLMIIIKYGRRYETENAKFCEETFVVKREHTKIKENIATISDEEMANPHIKFYCSRNPGWSKGHSLVAVALCTWNDVGESLRKAVMRSRPKCTMLT